MPKLTLVRREVMLPGNLLPKDVGDCPGKHHGTVVRVLNNNNNNNQSVESIPLAVIQLTDLRVPAAPGSHYRKKLRVTLSIDAILPYLGAKKKEYKARKWDGLSGAGRFTGESNQKAAGALGGSGAASDAFNSKYKQCHDDDGEDSGGGGQPSHHSKPRKPPPPPDVPVAGPQLLGHLEYLGTVSTSTRYPIGTRLWIKCQGGIFWPGISWNTALCPKEVVGDLVLGYRPGKEHVLVRFYGQHSFQWKRESDLHLPPDDESEMIKKFTSWGKQQQSSNSTTTNRNSGSHQHQLRELALVEMSGAVKDADIEKDRVIELYQRHLAMQNSTKRVIETCYLCREDHASLECVACQRMFHPICLSEPAICIDFLPNSSFMCPCCGQQQKASDAGALKEDRLQQQEGQQSERGEDGVEMDDRMGLTPDWIIDAACFRVFHLPRPTPEKPYIEGLLDPCTNSKLAPNIPAERLYDKNDNGLLLSNSWAGSYVVLNPEFSAQVQWRFINRAIDEVESGNVPALILVCRNSTDTSYFQRLRPYPRVLLRRSSARFKDYDKTPIGFGIAVFCLTGKARRKELYYRFHNAFGDMGEPAIPIDETFVNSSQYYDLLDRLVEFSKQHHRTHWVQCVGCNKWRILTSGEAEQVKLSSDEWSCSQLRPPFTSCHTPLTNEERLGGHYAAGGADGDLNNNMGQQSVEQKEEEGGGQKPASQQQTPLPPNSSTRYSKRAKIQAQSNSKNQQQPQVVITKDSMQEFIRLPPLNQLMMHRDDDDDDEEGGRGGGGQILTALELARTARIAANRAYLATLNATSQAMNSGSIQALSPGDPAVLLAARELANKAAEETAKRQLESIQRRRAVATKKRATEEADLLAKLARIRDEERNAIRESEEAEHAFKEMTRRVNRDANGTIGR